jgi:hypothetical protein
MILGIFEEFVNCVVKKCHVVDVIFLDQVALFLDFS